MKKFLLLIFIAISLLTLIACTDSNSASINNEYAKNETLILKYDIEQILFSKSFQSIDTSVEIISKNEDELKIIALLGLADYSTIEINKIIMEDNTIDIHVSGDKKKSENSLSVPQLIINFNKDDLKINNLENLKFNIVHDDYVTTKIKFKINDVLNKVESHFKVSTNTLPRYDLIKDGDSIVWEITYNNIFYKDIDDTPLMNLYALVDANSGEIIHSDKDVITRVLDTGQFLNYAQNEILLYKQLFDDKENNSLKELLYSYSIENKEKTLLYSSNYKISAAEISPDLKHLSFVETSDNGNDIYVIPYNKPKLIKIIFNDNFHPLKIKWKNEKEIYILGKEDKLSSIYSYNIDSNRLAIVNSVRKDIESFSALNDNFLLLERSENEYNKEIYLTDNFINLESLNVGFKPQFIDIKNIAYIKKDESTNIDYLSIYNSDENEIVRRIDGNVVSYFVAGDNIIYIKNNPSHNDYTMYKYSIESKEKTCLAHLLSDNIYFNDHDNIIYLNTVLPFENNNTNIIYSIDLDNIDKL